MKSGSEKKPKRPPPVPLFVLRGHSNPVYSCCFSERNELISGGGDGTLMLWNVETKRCTTRFAGAHADKAINAVRFFDDGKVWSQGRDGFVKQWDLASEQCVSAHELGCHSFVPMSTLQASGDQVCLTAIPDSEDMKGVLLLRLDARARDVSVAKRWEGLPKQGMCMRLSLSCNPGPVVLCGYENGDLVVHDVDKGWSKTTSIPVDEPKFPVTALAMNSGIGCAGGSESQLFTFQASDDGSLLFSEVRHSIPSKGVNDLCIREDKKLFASAGWDGKVRLFGLTKKKERMIGVCSFHSEPVNALSFQSKSKLLAAASSDGKISLWDL